MFEVYSRNDQTLQFPGDRNWQNYWANHRGQATLTNPNLNYMTNVNVDFSHVDGDISPPSSIPSLESGIVLSANGEYDISQWLMDNDDEFEITPVANRNLTIKKKSESESLVKGTKRLRDEENPNGSIGTFRVNVPQGSGQGTPISNPTFDLELPDSWYEGNDGVKTLNQHFNVPTGYDYIENGVNFNAKLNKVFLTQNGTYSAADFRDHDNEIGFYKVQVQVPPQMKYTPEFSSIRFDVDYIKFNQFETVNSPGYRFISVTPGHTLIALVNDTDNVGYCYLLVKSVPSNASSSGTYGMNITNGNKYYICNYAPIDNEREYVYLILNSLIYNSSTQQNEEKMFIGYQIPKTGSTYSNEDVDVKCRLRLLKSSLTNLE